MAMKQGIACGGNLIVDHIKKIPAWPAQGNLVTITEQFDTTGGLVCNVLLDLAKLDPTMPLYAIGLRGDDADGRLVEERLTHAGVDISGVQILPGTDTSYTDVLSTPDGNRTFFQRSGASAQFTDEHIPYGTCNAKVMHLGYLLLLEGMDAPDAQYGTVMAKALAKAREAGFVTCMDVVSEHSDRFRRIVPPSLKYVDLCVINEIEAEEITGKTCRKDGKIDFDGVEAALHSLMDMGVGRWAVIHFPEGACALERGGQVIRQASIAVPKSYIVGKVGAGDAFCAGILYSAAKDLPLSEAMRVATAAATSSLASADASGSVLPVEEALKLFDQYGEENF